jgi:L-malate glycosyltransferase
MGNKKHGDKKMKNVFLISREFPPSTAGASIAINSYIQSMNNYNFSVISYFKPEKEKPNINTTKINPLTSYRYISALHFIIKTLLLSFKKFDFMIGNALIGCTCGILIKHFKKIPLISMVYDVDSVQPGIGKFGKINKYIRKKIYKSIINNSDLIIVSSNKIKNDIINIFGEDASKKVKVLGIGVKIKPFEKIKKPENKKIVLTVGGIMEKRGLEYMINGFKKVVDKIKEAELWIVGPIIQKKYYEKIINLVKEQDIEKNVKFIGRKPYSKKGVNIFSYYDACDIFAVSSYYSMGFCLTSLEANLLGKPAVVTKIIEDVGVVINNKTGLVVPIKDSDTFGTAIIKLLENKNLREDLGKNSKLFAEKNFNTNSISKKYESLIKNALGD